MDKHLFVNHGSPERAPACVKCGLPQNHVIHHRVSKDEPELQHAPRIGRDEMFMDIVHVLRKRSTCLRGHVGCVIVQDRRIVSMGYNGAPPRQSHCIEVGCMEGEDAEGCQRSVHAEANAIAYAAKHGVGVAGATMYCTHSPCKTCAELIVCSGITRFYFDIPYRAARLDILEASGLTIHQGQT